MRAARLSMCLSVLAVTLACGKKGPPLPPLHLVPAAPAAVSVTRLGGEAHVRFTIPSTNLNGPGPVEVDRMEIFAATVAAGAVPPANRVLLTSKYRVGTIAVKPPPVEGETPPPSEPPDTRPSAGEQTTFVEQLTAETLKPAFTTPAPKAPASSATPAATSASPPTIGATPSPDAAAPAAVPAPSPATPPAAAPTNVPTAEPPVLPGAIPLGPLGLGPVASVPEPTYAVRVYTVRGVTKSGRPGQPAPRIQLPLVDPPSSPTALAATTTETAITLAWKPPASGSSVAFNVYKRGGRDPINSAPVTGHSYERTGLEFGTEECFAIRAVQKIGAVEAQSELSEPVCVTPRDTFPPKAPQHLSAVAAPGTINLSWDANTEKDLAGYLVLRGEAPGDTLQPLTEAPIAATNFEDKTAKPGVRYVYTIVAVDKATPPNPSPQSARIEETAR